MDTDFICRNQNGARVVPTRSRYARGRPFDNPNLCSQPVPLQLETSRAPLKSSRRKIFSRKEAQKAQKQPWINYPVRLKAFYAVL
jgi:hypothetical protein